MKELLKVMRHESLAKDWYQLGLELLPKNNNLETIKANYRNDNSTCCQEMFQTWLQVEPDFNWGQLVMALNEIGLRSAARAVSKKYMSGM